MLGAGWGWERSQYSQSRFLVERIITLLACSPLDAEHVGVLKAKHRAEREMLRQPGVLALAHCEGLGYLGCCYEGYIIISMVISLYKSQVPNGSSEKSLWMGLGGGWRPQVLLESPEYSPENTPENDRKSMRYKETPSKK